MLRLNQNVRLKDLKPQMVVAMIVVENACRQLGRDCVVTSGNDSGHGSGSLHYKGLALDFRTKHIPPAAKSEFVENVRVSLPDPDYDVIWEDAGMPNEHLHIEFDPK